MTYVLDKTASQADAAIALPRSLFERVLTGDQSLDAALQQPGVTVEGNHEVIKQLFGILDEFNAAFPIVEPRPARR